MAICTCCLNNSGEFGSARPAPEPVVSWDSDEKLDDGTAREKAEDVVAAKGCWLEPIAASITVTVTEPPTSRLPAIAKITTCTTTQLLDSIHYLRALYRPQVRGSGRRPRVDNASPDDDLRSDAFERAYAVRWLTALIAQLGAREPRSSTVTPSESDNTDNLIHQAASLLATCAGVAAAGRIQRRFTFESNLVGEIHVDLTDTPLDNQDYGSVGAQTWGSACVLAEMIAEYPDRFGLGASRGSDQRHLRILELGAGTGLVGLTVAKLLHASPHRRLPNPRLVSVVLTDAHPGALENLQSNIDANFPANPDDTDNAIRVHSHPLDWSSFSTTVTISDVLSTPFDIVFGADIVYEAQHSAWIYDCLQSLLAYPNGSNEDHIFHLVIPLRPTHTLESNTVEEVFGSKEHDKRDLTILTKECVVREAYGIKRCHTDDNVVEYTYYRIGWSP